LHEIGIELKKCEIDSSLKKQRYSDRFGTAREGRRIKLGYWFTINPNRTAQTRSRNNLERGIHTERQSLTRKAPHYPTHCIHIRASYPRLSKGMLERIVTQAVQPYWRRRVTDHRHQGYQRIQCITYLSARVQSREPFTENLLTDTTGMAANSLEAGI
jgi:hypothetical protein